MVDPILLHLTNITQLNKPSHQVGSATCVHCPWVDSNKVISSLEFMAAVKPVKTKRFVYLNDRRDRFFFEFLSVASFVSCTINVIVRRFVHGEEPFLL